MTDSSDSMPVTDNAAVRPAPNSDEVEGRRDLIRAFIFCVIAVIAVRSFLFEPFKIPSSSMMPTLQIGDHIFVSKFNYGFFVPFTKFEFARWSQPKRGEIIVFLFPRDESLHYIKRVVGVPGDRVEFRGRDLLINGEIVPHEKVTDPAVVEKVTGSRELRGDLFKETLGGIVHYVSYSRKQATDVLRGNVEVVPENKFFVAGDNRDDSYDSRSWGYVPRENIKGKAQMIWLSLDQEQDWGKLEKVRWGRCGTLIH